MLCLDLVTMTRGEGGNSESWVLVEVMFGGWCVEGGMEEQKRLFEVG